MLKDTMMKRTRRISPIKQLVISIVLFLSMIILMVLIGFFPNNVLYGSIFISMGSIPFMVSMYWVYTILEKRLWIQHSGKVVNSQVLSEISVLETSGYPIEHYVPIINYTYRVESKKNFSKRLSALENDYRFHTKYEAKKVLQKYVTGENINIWINPKYPSQSIIIQGCSKEKLKTIIGYIIIGLFSFGIGVFIMMS